MTLLVKKGSFSAPTSTGDHAVTGVGFQPKAVIFWLTSQTATGYATNKRFSFGFGASSSQEACCAYTSDDGSGVGTTIGSRQSDTHVLLGITCSGGVVAVELAAGLVSLDADGFTLNFGTTSGGTAYIVHYLALGGSDLTDAFVGNALSKTTTGTQGYTGVGFQPDALIAMTLARAAPATPSSFTGTRFALGAASGPTERVALQVQEDNVNPTSVNSIQVSDKIIHALSGAGADFIVADLDSFDADGFTLDWTTANGTARVFYYLALKGGQYQAGVETQKTSTGTKAKTGVGFQPSGLLLMGTNRAASASADTTLEKLSVGGGDGTTEGSTWASGTDNVSTTDENVASLTDKVLRHATNPSTTDAEADLDSLDADGFTLDWTTADATAREFGYLALGSVDVPATPGPARLAGPTPLGTSAATIYTAPAGGARVHLLTVENGSGSPCDLTLSIGADAAGTRLYDGWEVPADITLPLRANIVLDAGEIIQAFAETGATLNVTLDGENL